MKNRHTPQRSCVACRQTKGKKFLIRLVRGSNGMVEPDTSLQKPGRGAYLCPQKKCWETALKKNRLEHALQTKISNENHRILIEYSKTLPEEN